MNFCFEFLQELWMLWEAISNTRKSVIRYPNTSKLVKKKLGCASFFSTHFSVFGYLKHSSLCLVHHPVFAMRRKQNHSYNLWWTSARSLSISLPLSLAVCQHAVLIHVWCIFFSCYRPRGISMERKMPTPSSLLRDDSGCCSIFSYVWRCCVWS